MSTVYIDNQPYTVHQDQNLLHACLSLGFDLPYFCWHPAMGSVGACRQCAVKQFRDENDNRGRLVMACLTPAAEGTRISIANPEAREFRRSVIEWLMTNHPHDCPVCEEGGECHLQDMTHLTGQVYRRYRFAKRTFRNQDLGPFLNHEMNRCITCYRCVRFYRDYAGGDDLQALAIGNRVYFGRAREGTLENEFSGNLVEVCPTGVFTDKPFGAAYTRKWDLQYAPSVCTHCGVGCNTSPAERYGELRRILNRYHHDINGYFLCDRGRFGYAFVNGPERILSVQRRTGEGAGGFEPVDADEAIDAAAERLRAGRVLGIGSPRASLEANFALRTLVGPERFYAGVAAGEQALLARIVALLRRGPAQIPTPAELEQADAVLILGEDLTNTAPRLALALRQLRRHRAEALAASGGIPAWQAASVHNATGEVSAPLFLLTPEATCLDEAARQTWNGPPQDLATLGFAIAHAIDSDAPSVAELPSIPESLVSGIAESLRTAERPLVVSGTGCGSLEVVEAAAQVARALCARGLHASLFYAVPEVNSIGLALLEPRPLEEALTTLEAGHSDGAIVLENDLFRRVTHVRLERVLAGTRHLTVIDHTRHATAERADLVFPAASFAEAEGTVVNSEGRAQRYYSVYESQTGGVRESWRWLSALLVASSSDEVRPWETLDQVTAACAAQIPALQAITEAAPTAAFRYHGMRIPRASHRYSGRTAMHADRWIHEPTPRVDPDSALSFSMEGYHGPPPPALAPFVWAPSWNSNEALNKFQEEIAGPLRGGDPGVRLFDPPAGVELAYIEVEARPFQRQNDRWLILPRHHIFGSEELSMGAPAVAARAPQPYLAVHPDDAAALGLAEGQAVVLEVAGTTQRLALRLAATLRPGIAALPVGLRGTEPVELPAWGTLLRVQKQERERP